MPDLNPFGVSYKEYRMVSGDISSAHCMYTDFLASGCDPFPSVYVFFAAQSFTDHISCPKSGSAWGIFFLVVMSFDDLDVIVRKILCSFLNYLEEDVNAYGIIGGYDCTYLVFPDSFINY